MRTVSEKYANISNYYLDDSNFFSIETITVPIGFRLFAITLFSVVNNRKDIRLGGTEALVSRFPSSLSLSIFLSCLFVYQSASLSTWYIVAYYVSLLSRNSKNRRESQAVFILNMLKNFLEIAPHHRKTQS